MFDSFVRLWYTWPDIFFSMPKQLFVLSRVYMGEGGEVVEDVLAAVPCRNDEQTLIRLMNLYGTDIKRLCLCLLNDTHLAEDAAQETFVKAWKNLPGFRGDCAEKTWLCTIAVNTCRSMQRGSWFRAIDRRASAESLPEKAEVSPDYDPTVWNAVQSLPEKLKRSVVLRYYEGLTLQEAARALGTNVNTLHSRLRKAKSILETELKGWYFNEDE